MHDEPIRPGYKRTEVGVIPEDWEVRPLLDTVRIARGQVDPRMEPYRSMILVAPDHIESGSGRLIRTETASEQSAISGKYLFSPGDIVYSKIRPYLRKAILADFEGLCSADMYPLKPAPDVSGAFLFGIILGDLFSKYAESVSIRSGIPKINRLELAGYSIALPSNKSEQEAIAEVLSDVDALLDALERLIAKKRAIKQGAMQALLTGRVRLPGFERQPGYKRTEVGVIPEDWEVKTFGELFDFLSTSSCSRSDLSESGDIYYIHYGDIHTKWDYHLDFDIESVPLVAFQKVKNAARLQDGDLIMVDASEDEEGVGKSVEILNLGNRMAVSGLHTLALRSKGADLVNGFKAYLQANQAIKTQIRRVATGLKVFGISRNSLKDILAPLPDPAEQHAIAEVLSDMDAEIEALEQRRAKLRAIKQGMMQELLTGRVRLVPPKEKNQEATV